MNRLDPALLSPLARPGPVPPVMVRVLHAERDNAIFEMAGRTVQARTDSDVTVGERFLARVSTQRGQLMVQRVAIPLTAAHSPERLARDVAVTLSPDPGVQLRSAMTRMLVLLATSTPGSGSATGSVAALVAALTSLLANPERVVEIRRALQRLVDHAVGKGGRGPGAATPRLLSLIGRVLADLPTDLSLEARARLERSLGDMRQPLSDAARFRVEADDTEMRVVIPLRYDERRGGSAHVGFRFEGRPGERASPRALSFEIVVRPDGQARTSASGDARGDRLRARILVSGQEALAVAHAGLEPLTTRLRLLGFTDVELGVELASEAIAVPAAKRSLDVVI